MTAACAEHRPAARRRRFRHDDLIAVDLFSGFGGLTRGIENAGFTTIMAANHRRYKVQVHEANHPHAEHWVADLVDQESSDYHDVRDLPPGDLLAAGVSCTNHSTANTKRAYATGMSLFDMDDPDYEARVTKSEKDRATANCVLAYAHRHHPRLILVECTTELQSWGPLIPGKKKIGDGTTFRWWLKQHELLGYKYKILYLNSMFFGVPQSRDRLYIAFWDRKLPTPALEHRPHSWCGRCDQVVEAVWTWRTGIPLTGRVMYGQQYEYRCPRCRATVVPPSTPSLAALDLTDLGTRIGDKPHRKQRDGSVGPLALATLARAERCRAKFPEFPAVLMPAKATHGVERHPWQPMSTQTSQQETSLVSTGAVIAAHRHNGDGQHIGRAMDTVTTTHEKALITTGAVSTTSLMMPPHVAGVVNFQGSERGVDEVLPTQPGSETLGLLAARVMPNRTHATSRDASQSMETVVGGAGSGGIGVLSSGVIPYRKNTLPASPAEAMPTVTADQTPGLLTAAGRVQCNGSIDEAVYRAYPVDRPLGTVVGSATTQGLLFSGWYKQNGSSGDETAAHPVSDPLGTLTARDATALLMAQWRAALADLSLDDCYFRMLGEHEVGRGCGFDVDFPGHDGTFIVWGSARDQVDGFGNAVSPPVGEWIGNRLRVVLHSEAAA